LGTGYQINGRSTEEYEETVQQKETESSRIEGWRKCVVGEQEYPIKSTLKEAGPFKISKDIGSGAFQLELLEGWTIHNVFNKDLLTQCMEPKFKDQHEEPAPPPTIINKKEEYEVEEVRKYRKWGRETQYLMN